MIYSRKALTRVLWDAIYTDERRMWLAQEDAADLFDDVLAVLDGALPSPETEKPEGDLYGPISKQVYSENYEVSVAVNEESLRRLRTQIQEERVDAIEFEEREDYTCLCECCL